MQNLAIPTGLEPATSSVTGMRALQLLHETLTVWLVLMPPTKCDPVLVGLILGEGCAFETFVQVNYHCAPFHTGLRCNVLRKRVGEASSRVREQFELHYCSQSVP